MGTKVHATTEYLQFCSSHYIFMLYHGWTCPENTCLLLAIAAIAMHTSCNKETIVYCFEGSQHGLQAA